MQIKELIDATVRQLLKVQARAEALAGRLLEEVFESVTCLRSQATELEALLARDEAAVDSDSKSPSAGPGPSHSELQVLHFCSESAEPRACRAMPLRPSSNSSGQPQLQSTDRITTLSEISEKFKVDDWTVEETNSPLQPIDTAVRLETDSEARLRLQFLERTATLGDSLLSARGLEEDGAMCLLPVPTIVGGYLCTSHRGDISFHYDAQVQELPCPRAKATYLGKFGCIEVGHFWVNGLYFYLDCEDNLTYFYLDKIVRVNPRDCLSKVARNCCFPQKKAAEDLGTTHYRYLKSFACRTFLKGAAVVYMCSVDRSFSVLSLSGWYSRFQIRDDGFRQTDSIKFSPRPDFKPTSIACRDQIHLCASFNQQLRLVELTVLPQLSSLTIKSDTPIHDMCVSYFLQAPLLTCSSFAGQVYYFFIAADHTLHRAEGRFDSYRSIVAYCKGRQQTAPERSV